MTAIIRPAVVADARAIAEVHIRSWQEAYRGQLPDAWLDGLSAQLERREARWRETLAGRHGERSFVAERDGRLIGFVLVVPSLDDDATPDTGQLSAIYLLQEAWGIGVGRDLMTIAMADLRSRFRRATLWVLRSNARARRFYEIAGWRADGREKVEDWAGARIDEVRYVIDVDGAQE
ncbi:MAG TPA: GNAT family N-acetyltransferase [Candidatus Limnocylindria bacterium]